MKCADTATLRAYLDAELPSFLMHDLKTHRGGCSGCDQQLKDLEATAGLARASLGIPSASASPRALAEMRARIVEERRDFPGNPVLGLRIFKEHGRLLAAATVALVAIVIGLAPMQLAAEGLLGVFRVQTFAAVTIDPSQLPAMPKLTAVAEPQQLLPPDVRDVSGNAAAQAVDFAIKQPAYLPSSLAATRTFVSKPMDASSIVSLQELQRAAARAGAGDVQFPPSLDGATLRVNVPATLFTLFASTGEAPANEKTESPALVLVQTRGPTLEVPDTVDVAALREQVLAMPLLPPDVAKQLRAIKDWRHTLVIPVRAGTHKDVSVAGVPALLVSHSSADNTLLWQKDGVLYGLSGRLDASELMRIASSLR